MFFPALFVKGTQASISEISRGGDGEDLVRLIEVNSNRICHKDKFPVSKGLELPSNSVSRQGVFV